MIEMIRPLPGWRGPLGPRDALIQLLPGGHASPDPWHLGSNTAGVALQRLGLAVFAMIALYELMSYKE